MLPFPHWRRTLLCVLAALLASTTRGLAGPEPSGRGLDEDSLRAALVLNLARFAVWTEPVVDRFPICVAGDNALLTALQSVAGGQQVAGRPISILQVDPAADAPACRVLYIGRDERHAADVLLRAGQGVLTIGDRPEFVRDGGVVRVFVRDSRLRFEINQQAAERASIKIPAQLLALSTR